jgi:hypothetical protein
MAWHGMAVLHINIEQAAMLWNLFRLGICCLVTSFVNLHAYEQDEKPGIFMVLRS